MSSFLTVKQAARPTGKSTSSSRRIIYPILQDDARPDRIHIQPSIEDVLKLRVQGENFAWRLSEDLLRRAVPDEVRTEKASGAEATTPGADGTAELLAML